MHKKWQILFTVMYIFKYIYIHKQLLGNIQKIFARLIVYRKNSDFKEPQYQFYLKEKWNIHTSTVKTSALALVFTFCWEVLCLFTLIMLFEKSLWPEESSKAAVFFRTSGFCALYSIIWLLLCAELKPSPSFTPSLSLIVFSLPLVPATITSL